MFSLTTFFKDVEAEGKVVLDFFGVSPTVESMIQSTISSAVGAFNTALGGLAVSTFQEMVQAAMGGFAVGGPAGAEAAALAAGEAAVAKAGATLGTAVLSSMSQHAAAAAVPAIVSGITNGVPTVAPTV